MRNTFWIEAAWEQAVRHFLEAEDFERAAEIIAEHGGTGLPQANLIRWLR